ncbi:hypothetical protein TRFO_35732 [Tritrichomonas foetus]|uniref:Nucleoside diphosphate kinase-like domain-containing protein n=1 Tax=Tritrichomonas foetus TaxID=1144522 RepID=A0A1J4JGX2_9EUKA|nr:hypothetical protein TRFO_35732 [Tritrichomonas foetus]|eukprot:OHS97937.1 hypothetical protein TRFO_35732 [Tritrichomonas foetus]
MTFQHTYAMIKPGYEEYWGKVVERITEEGMQIIQMKTMRFDNDFADQFYSEHVGKEFYPTLQKYMTSGPIVALDLAGPDAIAHWRKIIGPTKKEVALETSPNSLRALYARSTTENLCHGSDSIQSAIREITLVFGESPPDMLQHTYAMIKPGYEEFWGKVVERIIEEGIQIVQMKTMEFTDSLADQFYAEHVGKGFYPALQYYMTSGQIVALDLAGPGVISKWREIIGPTNKEVAVEKAPNSLRALYARSTTENLCHGSDSEESAVRELTIIFGSAPAHMIKQLEPAEFNDNLVEEMEKLELLAMECKDVPTKADSKQKYLDSTVMPLVLEGISWIMKERPSDPVEHLAVYLLKNSNHEAEAEEIVSAQAPSRGSTPNVSKK